MSAAKVSISPVPRLSLTLAEAAACLSVSPEFFRVHVQPQVKIVRAGRRRIVPVSELQRWLDDNGESIVEDLA